MRNICIEAQRAEIVHNATCMSMDLCIENSEYETLLLTAYDIDDIIRIVGSRDLLEKMNTDDITDYLNDIRIKTAWEE